MACRDLGDLDSSKRHMTYVVEQPNVPPTTLLSLAQEKALMKGAKKAKISRAVCMLVVVLGASEP